MFIDAVTISVKAGDGGRGCRSFYRDKFQRRGIPDGGDGGNGADIIARADRNLHTLLDFRYHRHFRGDHGEHGSGKGKHGRNQRPIVIRVPCGTLIKEPATSSVLRDLSVDAEECRVARGGRGGLGNQHRMEPTEGGRGEERTLVLELKLIADVGLVGFPNAGKSTLVSRVSNAHPAIAAYPFTTKYPVLGVVTPRKGTPFVIADIPGLIEGSSQGRGLGDLFLKHVERTRLLLHVIDMAGSEARDPLEDYRIIRDELKAYSPSVAKKKQIIVANKMDLEGAKANLARFNRTFKVPVYAVSALAPFGLEELIEATRRLLPAHRRQVR